MAGDVFIVLGNQFDGVDIRQEFAGVGEAEVRRAQGGFRIDALTFIGDDEVDECLGSFFIRAAVDHCHTVGSGGGAFRRINNSDLIAETVGEVGNTVGFGSQTDSIFAQPMVL